MCNFNLGAGVLVAAWPWAMIDLWILVVLEGEKNVMLDMLKYLKFVGF